MKWKLPASGSRRSIEKFALIPVILTNRVTVVWLEKYKADQIYYDCGGWDTVETYDIGKNGPFERWKTPGGPQIPE